MPLSGLICKGCVVRFTYKNIVREGTVEYYRRTVNGHRMLCVGHKLPDGQVQFKSYNRDKVQGDIEVLHYVG